MNEEEKLQKDILFQIDMQLYNEFNDKFCEMNDNLGTIYTYKDIDDLEKLEKETEIKLLRKAIEKQQKEIERLKDEYKREVFEHQEFVEDTKVAVQDYIKKYKIKEKMKELEEMPENQYIHLDYIKKMLEELLGE